ncbi:GNAT family N-acetyltransferase [Bradyrhizobium algeriense]|uniref:GNAT family N-acetyltransferase n=1 Tax=Bradyrhizobium algeriense TaxID=634784 RepID=UPI001FCEDEEB|nr:GNAT family N-acetyltransferase [Bradyrhizobium algeriense]
MPVLVNRIKQLVDGGEPRQAWPQSWHWNWRTKMDHISGLLAFRTFALTCEGKVQGLMQINTAKNLCRLPAQAGKHLAYVDYVETAPWNRVTVVGQPRFGGVGVVMVRAAIEVSRDEGFHGRIGLHSLPQSESFYADVCGMSDLGLDGTKENLRYFEMTSEQSTAFSS